MLFLAGVRFAGVFLAGVLFLAGVALVVDAAAGRTCARVVSEDVAGEVAGVSAATGLVGRTAVAEKTSLDRAKKASAGSAETIQPNTVGSATASCAVSETPTALTSRNIGYCTDAPVVLRRRRAISISDAVGINSLITALAQPNQSGVPDGLLSRVN